MSTNQGKLPANRVVIAVLVVALIGIVTFSTISTQLSSSPAIPASSLSASSSAHSSVAPTSAPTASASAQDSALRTQDSSPAAKPFLSEYQDPAAEPAPNGALTVASLLFKLAIVLALIYLTVLALRWFGQRGKVAFLSQSTVSVLETTKLAQNRELYLVDVADRVLLLGATTGNISVLSEFTDPATVEGMRTRPQPALPSAEPFMNYLRAFAERVGVHPKEAPRFPTDEEVDAIPADMPLQLAIIPRKTPPPAPGTTPLTPADLLAKIESHKLRLRENTTALQDEVE